MSKVAVVLAGSGAKDGSEIHEAVATLLALDRAGADIQCVAPDIEQMHVIDHAKGKPAKGMSRNVLVESARIARGDIRALNKIKATDFDAIIFPGGFGAAKNLCDYAVKGADCRVNSEIENLINLAYEQGIPMGFICISPVVAAKVLGAKADVLQLTIGNDPDTAADLRKMGAEHVERSVEDCCVDHDNKLVTTPAYMLGQSIAEVATGIEKLVKEVLNLI